MSIFSWLFRKSSPDLKQPGPSHFRLIGSDTVSVKVVGTSRYQKQIATLAGPKSGDGKRDRLRVLLVEEPDNAHDANAVRVQFQCETIGYLPKKEAIIYRDFLSTEGLQGKTANVSANVVGGWLDGDSEGSYGIHLLHRKPFKIGKEPSAE
ncbi:HIRAN domain-containing protein [Sulfitobacter sp. SH24]|uniref:HIRAN domain-containing protein n=1 Tax=Sulfitobacter sp. SH24 TaxID=3421173 RepID=UPI003F506FB5